MFLAIAVDNLANAQELTAAEEEAEQLDEQVRCSKKNISKCYYQLVAISSWNRYAMPLKFARGIFLLLNGALSK